MAGELYKSHRIAALDWQRPERLAPDDLARLVTDLYEDGKRRREWWEREAEAQLHFVEGDQQITFTQLEDTVDRVQDAFSHRDAEGRIPFDELMPLTINGLKGVVLQKIAMFLTRPAGLFAVPESSDDEDVRSARVGSRLLNYLWHNGPEPIRRRLVEALWMTFSAGMSFIHPYWCAEAGPRRTFKPIGGESGSEFRKRVEALGLVWRKPDTEGAVTLPLGDVDWLFPTPFDITEPYGAVTISDCDWIIETRLHSCEWLRWKYGERAAGLEPDAGEAVRVVGPRGRSIGENGSRWGENDPSQTSEQVITHYFWRPRRPWSESGALVVVAGGKCLSQGPNPFQHGELPYAKLQEQPSIYFRPRCSVHNDMGMQFTRNNMRSQMAAHARQTIAPKYFAEDGVLRAEDLDAEDRVVRVKTGSIANQQFQVMAPPVMNPQVFALDDRLRDDMMDTAGIHHATAGRADFGGQSGRHAALLRQGDIQGGFVTRELLETALNTAGRQSLWLYFQFVDQKRTVSYTGRELAPDVLDFKGKDLGRAESGPHSFNVRIKLGADWDPAELVNRIEAMTRLGYWSPQREADRQRVNRMVGEELPPEFDPEATQRSNARLENDRLIAKRTIYVSIGDDHDLHIEEHQRETTSERYREAFAADPACKARFELHIWAHEFEKAQRQVAKAAMLRQLMGGPAAPGPTDEPAENEADENEPAEGELNGRGAALMGLQ